MFVLVELRPSVILLSFSIDPSRNNGKADIDVDGNAADTGNDDDV